MSCDKCCKSMPRHKYQKDDKFCIDHMKKTIKAQKKMLENSNDEK